MARNFVEEVELSNLKDKTVYLKLSPGTATYKNLMRLAEMRQEDWQEIARKALDRYIDDFLFSQRLTSG